MAGMKFKPLLAATVDPKKEPGILNKIRFPLSVSPKFDGIRTLPRNGTLWSRKLLALPNPFYQARFNDPALNFLDTEGVYGDPCDGDNVYNRTQSLIMTGAKNATHADDTTLYAFDTTDESVAHLPFYQRLEIVQKQVALICRPDVVFVEHKIVESLDEFLATEEEFINLGYEGIMGRKPDGHYKHNRSTFAEHILLKYKRFEDFEAPIVGFIEQTTNTNAKVLDELGNAKRSSAKAGLVPANTLGRFVVFWEGREHEIPCGAIKHRQRKEIWDNQDQYLGKLLKVRHFPNGAKAGGGLRLPRAIGFRSPEDM